MLRNPVSKRRVFRLSIVAVLGVAASLGVPSAEATLPPALADPPVVMGFSSSGSPPCNTGENRCYRNDTPPIVNAPRLRTFKTTLLPPRPSPFRTHTMLSFVLDSEGPASLRLHDVLGRPVRTWAKDRWSVGANLVAWDGRDVGGGRVAAGVYFVRRPGPGPCLLRALDAMFDAPGERPRGARNRLILRSPRSVSQG